MFSFQITPRFGDIDGLGHVNNNVVPTWFGKSVPVPPEIINCLEQHYLDSKG